MDQAALRERLRPGQGLGDPLLPVADEPLGRGGEARTQALGDRLPGVAHAVVQDLEGTEGGAAPDHQAEIGLADGVPVGLPLDLGPVRLLGGAGLGARAMREVRDRIQPGGEVLEAPVQGVMARRPPVGARPRRAFWLWRKDWITASR
jgi:hypothetical protein